MDFYIIITYRFITLHYADETVYLAIPTNWIIKKYGFLRNRCG